MSTLSSELNGRVGFFAIAIAAISLVADVPHGAEQVRDVFTELRDLSARKTAEMLNARGVPTPEGGKWYATQVIRVRKRLRDE
jgi:hypothetical protein